MTVKEFCLSQKTIAVSSEMGGIEVKAIEYGINDYIYCVSNCLCDNEDLRRYHHVKIHYEFSLDIDDSRPYIKLLGGDRKYQKVYLDEMMRTDVVHDMFKKGE